MKTLFVSSALALSTFLFAVPVSAHHNSNSPFSDELEGLIPVDALETHNDAVDAVLDRMEELGVAGMMGGESVNSNMDPADSSQGNTCALWSDVACDTEIANPEVVESGMDRGPEVTPLPDDLPSGL